MNYAHNLYFINILFQEGVLKYQCSIQGLVVAHRPPVALSTWPYADIPARLFRLPKILGTEGFCKQLFCVLTVRSRRQGVRWDIVADFTTTELGAWEKGGFIRH